MPSETTVPIATNLDKTSDETEEIIIGRTPLDPTSTERCWACFVPFRDNDNCYTQHEHPTLGVLVCSVCHDGAEYVEGRILNSGKDDDEDSEAYCSFCSLPSSSLDPPYPPLADENFNDLFLCDACPRAFCQKCVCVKRGGTKEDLAWVRLNADSDGEWRCGVCEPTDFLLRLKRGYDSLLNDGEAGGGSSDGEEGDELIAKLIDELRGAEEKYSLAQQNLEDHHIEHKRREIEAELVQEQSELKTGELAELVDEEVENYRSLWMENAERLQEIIGKLLNELEDVGVDAADVYQFWKDEEGKTDDMFTPGWKAEADMALDQRDINEGFSKGEFRGATGYKAKDSRIYKLEPEDLNPTCLKEIEDINSTEGAITQMNRLKSHQERSNQWGSKTGTTAEDIEMFEKKCTKFEEINLGDKIDLKALEKNYIKDKDDLVQGKNELMTMTVRRKNGGSHVVRRTATVHSTMMQVKKEAVSAKLSGYSKEYTPSLSGATVARKEKKRAQLLPLPPITPGMKGILIGSNVSFEDSDIVLPMNKGKAKISICKPLAALLKEHQIEGVEFCWKRICSHLFDSEGGDAVRGAILAHSMGVGKSIQTVALLHTLLTHPSLVRSCATMNGGSTDRLIRRVLLVAPVNTLSNWEAEFKKWVGEKDLPFIRYLPWKQGSNIKQKIKLIKEWQEYGGILCCSNGNFAGTVKSAFKTEDTKLTESDRVLLQNALVNPGPDIIVLDEAHTMLKNNSNSIYQVLNGIHTKLRLSLTGTPLQNSLTEYYHMANWTKPGCLGSEARFASKYEKPIMAGMAADCTKYEAEIQEKLSAELRQFLSEIVHRCSKDVLRKILPFKQDAIIHIRQSKPQAKLYREYAKYKRANTVGFFDQFHALRPVGNHPACLPFFRLKPSEISPDSDSDIDIKKATVPSGHAWHCDICKVAQFETFEEAEEHEATCTDFFDDKDTKKEKWWKSFHDSVMRSGMRIDDINHGGKIIALLQILAHCDAIGDKVVIFSESLGTLDFIEEILQSNSWAGFNPYLPDISKSNIGGWKKGVAYLRIDGSVDADTRGELINSFNTKESASKVLLASIKACGVGVNLVAANRVILFDAHWNPAITDQAVHRCYRYGQTKPVYCYHFLAEGSMEEKIYSRAATKTSLSDLIVDEKNIDRLFSRRELDLLQENDIWVNCEACNKWRMLPQNMPDEEVANLPEKWYCKDNIHDPDRSFCDAPEQDAQWYAYHWEAQMKESQGNSLTPFVAPKGNDDSLEEFVKRDIVLQTLLSRSEGISTASANQAANSWISKYAFSRETLLQSPGDQEEPKKTTPRKSKVSSPKKRKQKASSPTRSSPRKSSAMVVKKEVSPAKHGSATEKDAKIETPVKSKPTSAPSPIGRIPRKSSSNVTKGHDLAPEFNKMKENHQHSKPTNAKTPSLKQEPKNSTKKSSSSSSVSRNVAHGNKRKSPQLMAAAKKTRKSNPNNRPSLSKTPETIDLIDSDSD